VTPNPVRRSPGLSAPSVTLVVNLGVAFGVTVITLAVAVISYPAILRNPTGALLAAIALLWLGGAVGLFFHSRLAWCGSVLGIATLAAIPLVLICNTIVGILTAKIRSEVIYHWIFLLFGHVGLGVWLLIFLDHIHLRCALTRGELARPPIKPKTVAFVVVFALIFCGAASAFSGFTSSLIEGKRQPWAGLWMMLHLPALIAYIGTLAEHDPWRGKGGMQGGFIFICLQWAVLGVLLGFLADFLREWMKKLSLRKPVPGPPPPLGAIAR
jgi:hypothetical protein